MAPVASLSSRVLSLASFGYSYEDIADMTGASVSLITRVIAKAIASSLDEHRVSIIREAELNKLQAIDEVFLPQALEGDFRSVAVVFKASERRASLVGLDKAPPAVNVQFNLVALLAGMRASLPRDEPVRILEGEVL